MSTPMSVKSKRSSLLLVLAFGGGLCVAKAGEALNFDPRDFQSIQKEIERIRHEYKGDPLRIAEEQNRVTREVAKAAGVEAEFDERLRLEKKYAPLFSLGETSPPPGHMIGTYVDHAAWQARIEPDGSKRSISFYLDKTRYKDATPKNIVIQLRRKGGTEEEEMKLFWGNTDIQIERTNLEYKEKEEKLYVVSIDIPSEDLEKYVIQISADIEPHWSTSSVLELK
jgi:hypothetical protein